jgi:hypothetical protein
MLSFTKYCYGDEWRRMRWAGRVARIGDIINAQIILVEGRRRRLVDNIRMDLRGMIWGRCRLDSFGSG